MTIARTYLALIVTLFFAWGARKHAEMWLIWPDGDFSRELGPAYFFLPLLALLFLWCRADARARQVKLTLLESITVALLFPIGIPYYFVRSFALRPALIQIGLAVAYAAICIGAVALGARVMFQYYTGWSGQPF